MHLANVRRARDAEATIQAEDRTSCDEFARRLKERFAVEDVGVSIDRVPGQAVMLRIKIDGHKWKRFKATKEVKTVDGVVRAEDLIQYRRKDVIGYLQSLDPAQVSSPGHPCAWFACPLTPFPWSFCSP
jgi:hypothetical protein